MPFDPTKVAIAVSSGLSIVCATCENYWRARDLAKPGDQCMATEPCGSPIAGDVFHQYVGPMSQFDEWCFVCGSPSTQALRVKGFVRVIGCCNAHVHLVRDMRPEGKAAVTVVIQSNRGESLSTDRKPEKNQGVLRMRMEDGEE
jgi:hypothetical protein